MDAFPQTMGCYGPGSYPAYVPTCTSNANAAYKVSVAPNRTVNGFLI